MDIYGVGNSPGYRNSNTDGGWDFSGANGSTEDWTILGDVITNQPLLGSNNNHGTYGSYRTVLPPFGARRGDYAFCADEVNISRFSFGGTVYAIGGQESPRLSIPGATETVRIIHVAFACDALPAIDAIHGHIFSFQNSSGEILCYLGVNPSGRLVIWDNNTWSSTGSDVEAKPNALALSSSPVIQAETWHSLSIKMTTNPTDHQIVVQIYEGDIVPANLVMDTTVTVGSVVGVHNIDILGLLPPPLVGQNGISTQDPFDTTKRYIRDLVICNTAGSYNNDHLGQVFVAAQEMRTEDAGGGWEAHPREKIDTGVVNVLDGTGLRVGDNAAFEFGTGDFTVEGFFRIAALPTGSDQIVLWSKWQADDNNRSYRLYWDATADEIVFEVSTDGTAITEVIRYPWIPDIHKYYFIALARDTGTIRLYIDGVQIGVDITDSNNYHNGGANFGIFSQWNSGNTLVTSNPATGFFEELRVTKGVARYTGASHTVPTAKFGRNGVDDANYSSVSLLIGADGGVIDDESSNTFTVVAGAGVTADMPDDSDNSYEVLNRRAAWDDTYIEARNTFATTILTLTAQPTDGETITLGSITYTYKTTLSSGPTVANEILIGSNTLDTLQHTIEAVNGGTGIGTDYSTGTVANTNIFASALPDPQALFTATAIGTAGNSQASTETLANGSFSSGATLSGGEDIPSPSDFAIERLPVDVTGVLGMQITARGYKSDAGSAQIRFDLKGPAAAVDTGSASGTDLSPSWLYQIFEEDPDTSATITPSTITGGRVRVTRTA